MPAESRLGQILSDPELRQAFLESSQEACEELDTALLALEADSTTQDQIHQAFRIAHNLKSAFASAGLQDAVAMAHGMESVFERLRSGESILNDSLRSQLLAEADRVRAIVEALDDGSYVTVSAATSAKARRPAEIAKAVGEDALVASPVGELVRPAEGFELRLRFDPAAEDAELQAIMLLNKCREAGELCYCLPNLEQEGIKPGAELRIGLSCVGADERQRRQILKTLDLFALTQKEVERITSGPKPPRPAAAVKATGSMLSKPSRSQSLRVDMGRLDGLVHLGAEFSIHRTRLRELERMLQERQPSCDLPFDAARLATRVTELAFLAEGLARESGGPTAQRLARGLFSLRESFEGMEAELVKVKALRSTVQELGASVESLDRVGTALERQVMEVRMQPVGPFFGRFRRLVRDLAKGLGKQVQLELRGEQTEVDKRMLDELADPLMHMLRNAIDHGVEPAEQRRQAGKDACACIVLEASRRSRHITLALSDDGRGIDPQRVRRKLQERGLLDQGQAEALSEPELLQYLFHPGFSTAKELSEISGRGMGLDIALAKVQELGGQIEVESQPGSGTRFLIQLPLTMAPTRVQLFELGAEIYAIPVEGLGEVLTLPREKVRPACGQRVFQLGERIYRICPWDEFFAAETRPSGERHEIPLLLLGAGEQALAFEVDRVLGQKDVILQDLPEGLRGSGAIAAACILEDGLVTLVLDPEQLVKARGGHADDQEASQQGEGG